ncbi:MAG: DUF917 family protein [Patescibacteria group bacterium]
MYTLTPTTINQMLLGATLLATGGGCTLESKQKAMQELPCSSISILEKADLKPEQMICTVYGVGPASKKEHDFTKMIQMGAATVQEYTYGKLVGFFLGELGAEQLAFQAAVASGLSVIDADGTGGRAVPEIVQDMFVLQGKSTLPAFVVGSEGIITTMINKSAEEVEAQVRRIVKQAGSPVLVFDHIIPASEIDLLNVGSIKESIRIGSLLQTGGLVAAGFSPRLKRSLPPSPRLRWAGKATATESKSGINTVATGRICTVDLDPADDFLNISATITNDSDTYTLLGKNELLVLKKNNKSIITCPDLIMLIDQNGNPIHNSKLDEYQGQPVTILTKSAIPQWQTPIGKKLFGPERFGL